MNPVSRGIRNAFRNTTRTISIVVILGLSMGLALAMLIAHQAVNNKIASVKASVANTITIAPAGFSGFSSVNNSLTTSQLKPVSSLDHVTGLTETLTDRLTTIGSTQPSFFGNSSSSSTTNQTSLTSPVTINTGSGAHFFISGGAASSALANFSPPVSIVGTNDPSSVNDTTIDITSGSDINGNSDNNEAIVSSAMASKNNLKVGSTFTAYSKTLTVEGIFSDSSTNSTRAAEGTVIVSLPTEQALSGQSGDVTSATATVDSIDNLTAVTNEIKNKLGSSADVTSSETQADEAVAPLNSVKSISVYSLIGAVIAGGVIILLTMVMIVRERTREIGVIKAIGASNRKIAFQFMTEATTLTLIGAVVGIILAIFAANPITHMLVSNSTTSTSTTISGPGGFSAHFNGGAGVIGGPGGRFTTGGKGALGFVGNNFTNIHAAVGWSILGYGLLATIVISLVGSATVSYFIAKIRPAEVMRTE